MLKIVDIETSKDLDRSEMAGVVGGTSDLERLSALLNFSTSIHNKVADVQQSFGLSLAQGNSGAVTNNQAIQGGNGVVYAPVTQTQTQGNYMELFELGKTLVS
jgi:hypothetical protein